MRVFFESQEQNEEITDDGFSIEERAAQIEGEKALEKKYEDERAAKEKEEKEAKKIAEEKIEEQKVGLIFLYKTFKASPQDEVDKTSFIRTCDKYQKEEWFNSQEWSKGLEMVEEYQRLKVKVEEISRAKREKAKVAKERALEGNREAAAKKEEKEKKEKKEKEQQALAASKVVVTGEGEKLQPQRTLTAVEARAEYERIVVAEKAEAEKMVKEKERKLHKCTAKVAQRKEPIKTERKNKEQEEVKVVKELTDKVAKELQVLTQAQGAREEMVKRYNLKLMKDIQALRSEMNERVANLKRTASSN